MDKQVISTTFNGEPIYRTDDDEYKYLLSSTDWKTQRHLEQLEMVKIGIISSTSLTEDEFNDLLKLRQSYRDNII